jgi:hypothetical protein
VEGFETAYSTRVYGDRQPFNLNDREGNSLNRSTTYEITVIQSLLWPGFFTIVNPEKQRWSHLYLGLGVKYRQPFIPDKIKDFEKEPNDLKEVPEVRLSHAAYR